LAAIVLKGKRRAYASPLLTLACLASARFGNPRGPNYHSALKLRRTSRQIRHPVSVTVLGHPWPRVRLRFRLR